MQDLPRNTEAARQYQADIDARDNRSHGSMSHGELSQSLADFARLKLRGSQQRLTLPASAALFAVDEKRVPAGEYFVQSIDREKHVWHLVDFSGRFSFAVHSRDTLPFA